MVYYVRFLKTARTVVVKPGLTSITALVTVTTDLGDAFLAEDVVLHAQVIDARDSTTGKQIILQDEAYKWTAGRRELAISIGPLPTGSGLTKIILAVGFKSTATAGLETDLNDAQNVPLVVSGWSAPFSVTRDSSADKLIERRFLLPKTEQCLGIWEETGNNIARHIWDAALAAVICLQTTIHSSEESGMSRLRNRLQASRDKPLQAIELGSGCGVVGIALAQMLESCSVTLTDLAEVDEITARNLRLAPATAGISRTRFRVLDWDEEVVDTDVLQPGLLDLVLVSDCTYNADSLPALVNVLRRLVESSPKALVLVSLKRRHDTEAVFFDLMKQADFVQSEESVYWLPAAYSERDRIEIYGFERRNS